MSENTKTEITEYEKMTSNKHLILMTWPIFFELLLQLLVGNVDQIMIGKFSEFSVGAVANANQIINLILISFNIICMATIILISLYNGSGDKDKVEQIYSVSLVTNFVISIAISLMFFFLGDSIVAWLNVPAELVVETENYIGIIGSCMFLQGIYLTFSSILKSNTMMKESLFVSMAVNLVNIIGNSIFIFGNFGIPALGVSGAAISSNLSRVVGIIIMFIMFKKKIGVKLTLKHFSPFPDNLLKRLMRIGLPAGIESVSYSLSQVYIQKIINTIGTISLSTKAYASIFANISFVYTVAISQSTQIVVGYILGRGEPDLAYEKVLKTLRLSVGITVVIATSIWFFSDHLFSIFTQNPEILALGKTIMFVDIFLEIGRAFNIVFVRGLQAAGDSVYPIILCVFFAWVVALLGGYILAVHMEMGLVGIWIAMAVDECMRACLFYFRWKSRKWESKSLIN